ncbi:hypothetical protein M432DRAFT_38421 [Thermoascus aurantiacus ATCC 26904]
MLTFIRSTYLTLSSCLNFAPLVAYRIRFPFLSIIHIIFFYFLFVFFGCLSPHCTPEFFLPLLFFVLSPLLSCMTSTYIPILIILLSMFMSMSMSRSRSRCLHIYHTIPHYTIPYLSLQWHRIWRVR